MSRGKAFQLAEALSDGTAKAVSNDAGRSTIALSAPFRLSRAGEE